MDDTIPRRGRRTFLRHVAITAGLAAAFPGLSGAAAVVRQRGRHEDLRLRYDRPAGAWVEAVPVGNGRLGAMVFGRVAQERIQLNEDTLFAGGPYSADNPASLAALPKVRALIDERRYAEAATLASQAMMGKPLKQMPYGAAGDLLIDVLDASAPAAYERTLDLDTAIAATRLGDGAGRRVFASAPDDVIAVRLTAAKGGTLDLDVHYRFPRKAKYGERIPAGVPWDHREERDAPERPSGDGPATLLAEGRNESAEGIAGALRYAVRVQAVADGEVRVQDGALRIRGARSVTLLVAAATSYVNFHDVSGDPVAAVRARTQAASAKPYARLEADHVRAHRALFDRLSLRLGAPPETTTDRRVATAETAPDPALAALYVQYARYLLMASSRPGSQPANLQGLWNEGINPPWGGKYTININTEMNYWPAHPANLAECAEPLLRMVEDLAVTGAVTAQAMYGARGWVAHHNTDLWRATAPIDGPNWGLWPCGGAWLCRTLWEHYEYRPDTAYLRRIWPLLRGAALFFVDTLVEDPGGRGLVTSPSISPENRHPFGSAVCAGPAMDRQIVRDLFGWTLAAHRLLGDPDAELAQVLEAKRARLAPDRVGAQGQLQEWLEDWDAQAPEQQHRHVSHLYAVYPSEQINVRDTPDLVRAAQKTLDTRGDKSTGWATAWRLALWARMGEGERAHAILLGLLGPERTYPNLFDAHPPFQIDGNFGGTAGILEMLVQSWGGEVRLLPALPRAWAEGEVKGVRARGGVEVDVAWRGGRLVKAALRGVAGQRVKVRYGERVVDVVLDKTGSAAWGLAPRP